MNLWYTWGRKFLALTLAWCFGLPFDRRLWSLGQKMQHFSRLEFSHSLKHIHVHTYMLWIQDHSRHCWWQRRKPKSIKHYTLELSILSYSPSTQSLPTVSRELRFFVSYACFQSCLRRPYTQVNESIDSCSATCLFILWSPLSCSHFISFNSTLSNFFINY